MTPGTKKGAKRRPGRPTKAQQVKNKAESMGLALPIPQYLLNSQYYSGLRKKDQDRILEWGDYIRTYTAEKLSEAEYYSMATIMLQAEKLDVMQARGEEFDIKMAEECRRSKALVMDKMEAYRDSARSKKGNSLGDIRKMFARLEAEDGSELEITVAEKKPKPAVEATFSEVIDLDATPVRPGEGEGDPQNNSGELDAPPEAD